MVCRVRRNAWQGYVARCCARASARPLPWRLRPLICPSSLSAPQPWPRACRAKAERGVLKRLLKRMPIWQSLLMAKSRGSRRGPKCWPLRRWISRWAWSGIFYSIPTPNCSRSVGRSRTVGLIAAPTICWVVSRDLVPLSPWQPGAYPRNTGSDLVVNRCVVPGAKPWCPGAGHCLNI